MPLNTPDQSETQESPRPGGLSFAEQAAAIAFGRDYIPPRYRNFVDVSPIESLTARKAARFGDCDDDMPALADAFERAVRGAMA